MNDHGPPPWEMKYTGSRGFMRRAVYARRRGQQIRGISMIRQWRAAIAAGLMPGRCVCGLALAAPAASASHLHRQSRVRAGGLRGRRNRRSAARTRIQHVSDDDDRDGVEHLHSGPRDARSSRGGRQLLPLLAGARANPRRRLQPASPTSVRADKPHIFLIVSRDAAGAMYGGLELAEQIRTHGVEGVRRHRSQSLHAHARHQVQHSARPAHAELHRT